MIRAECADIYETAQHLKDEKNSQRYSYAAKIPPPEVLSPAQTQSLMKLIIDRGCISVDPNTAKSASDSFPSTATTSLHKTDLEKKVENLLQRLNAV
jgi:hypothetical protein